MTLNLSLQHYNGLPLRLIERYDYKGKKAKRFVINDTNQNIWIPNKHLANDGTILEGENLNYVFATATKQLELAGFKMGFIPIIKKKQERPDYPRWKPVYQEAESEEIHPEINSMDDYYRHYGDMPY